MSQERVKIATGKIRMSYVVLERPRAMLEGQEPKYSMRFLIPKSDERTIERIKAAIKGVTQKAMQEKWGGRLPENFKAPLRDGDLEHFESDTYTNHYFMNASSKIKPLVVDQNKREISHLSEVYSGCYGKVIISFYAYTAPSQSGIGCNLLGVQKLAEGERLGRTITAEDFDEEDLSYLD